MVKSNIHLAPVLGLCVVIALPAAAMEQAASNLPATQPPAETAQPRMPQPEPLFRLGLRFGDGAFQELPVFEHDPFGPLLEAVRQGAKAAAARPIKPAQVPLEVAWLLPEEPARVLGELPPLRILSTALWGGGGKSQIEMAPFQRQISEEGKTGRIDWQGLLGELTYRDPQLTAAEGQFKVPGLHVVADGEADMRLRDMGLSFTLDADGLPRKLAFQLPELRIDGPDGNFVLRQMSTQGQVAEARPGLDLGDGVLRVEGIGFQRGEEQVQLTREIATT